GLEKLQKGPNCYVLKCGISTCQESLEISMNTSFRLHPALKKHGVVPNFRRKISQSGCAVSLHLNALRCSQWNEHIKHTQTQSMGLKLGAKMLLGNFGCHLRLHTHRHVQI